MNKNEYKLLDCGDFKRLEQVGPYLIVRPSPAAVWPTQLDSSHWQKADAEFVRKSDGNGKWRFQGEPLPESWLVHWQGVNFNIKLTSFGHLGLFAEHAQQWPMMRESLEPNDKVLNLFAYTGGASIVCAQQKANVTHVDASKTSVNWASENAKSNDVDLRWIVDDAMDFVKKEVRRNNKYEAIILDPPSYGRGTKNQIWKIEKDLPELLQQLEQLKSDSFKFMLLTAHSPGYGPQSLANLLISFFDAKKVSSGEMLLNSESGFSLPSGSFALYRN